MEVNKKRVCQVVLEMSKINKMFLFQTILSRLRYERFSILEYYCRYSYIFFRDFTSMFFYILGLNSSIS